MIVVNLIHDRRRRRPSLLHRLLWVLSILMLGLYGVTGYAAYHFYAQGRQSIRSLQKLITEDPDRDKVYLVRDVYDAGQYDQLVRVHSLIEMYQDRWLWRPRLQRLEQYIPDGMRLTSFRAARATRNQAGSMVIAGTILDDDGRGIQRVESLANRLREDPVFMHQLRDVRITRLERSNQGVLQLELTCRSPQVTPPAGRTGAQEGL